MVDRYDNDDESPAKKKLSLSNTSKIPNRQSAVSLKDGSDDGGIPIITAAGRGKIAEQILQLAFENDIKVRKDSALAEMLVQIEVDSPIPSEAFMAIGEILSYVYKASGRPNPFDSSAESDKT